MKLYRNYEKLLMLVELENLSEYKQVDTVVSAVNITEQVNERIAAECDVQTATRENYKT